MKPPTMAPMYVMCWDTVSTIARECGYALAIHGSLERDLDLLAAPWTEEAVPAEELIARIAKATAWMMDGAPRVDGPIRKPHGRLGWLIPFHKEYALDISVMPLVTPPPETACPKCGGCGRLCWDAALGTTIRCDECEGTGHAPPPTPAPEPRDECCEKCHCWPRTFDPECPCPCHLPAAAPPESGSVRPRLSDCPDCGKFREYGHVCAPPTPAPEPLGTCDVGGHPMYEDPHPRTPQCVNWEPSLHLLPLGGRL